MSSSSRVTEKLLDWRFGCLRITGIERRYLMTVTRWKPESGEAFSVHPGSRDDRCAMAISIIEAVYLLAA
jgi:hypothetical protein